VCPYAVGRLPLAHASRARAFLSPRTGLSAPGTAVSRALSGSRSRKTLTGGRSTKPIDPWTFTAAGVACRTPTSHERALPACSRATREAPSPPSARHDRGRALPRDGARPVEYRIVLGETLGDCSRRAASHLGVQVVTFGNTSLSPDDFRMRLAKLVADARDRRLSTERVTDQLAELVEAMREGLT
jgi:hypothetical protein